MEEAGYINDYDSDNSDGTHSKYDENDSKSRRRDEDRRSRSRNRNDAKRDAKYFANSKFNDIDKY